MANDDLMPRIQIEITRFADDAFPGWVEFVLIDAGGEQHRFVEKVPVVTTLDLGAASSYPVTEWIPCEVVDGPANGTVRVDLSRPLGLESIEGRTEFELTDSRVQ